MLSKKVKKILFFWVLFNLIGYVSYLTDIHPKIDIDKSYQNQHLNYILTPKYNESYYDASYDISKEIQTICCSSLEYSEQNNIWPFHKFTYEYYTGETYDTIKTISGFVGIYGYYGHFEFVLYVILPFVFIGIVFLYRKLFP